jgi:cytochrome c-type biogenesis protein CcmH
VTRRSRSVAGLLLVLVALPVLAIDEAPAFADEARQARYEALTQELRCVVCQSNSIADSNASMAADLRRQVREMIAAGRTDDEVRDFMVARYGDFVLYKPPVTTRTYLLWASPVLLLLGGLGVAFYVIRGRAARPVGPDPDEVGEGDTARAAEEHGS